MASGGGAEKAWHQAEGLQLASPGMGPSAMSDLSGRPPDDPREQRLWRQQVLLAEEGESQLSSMLDYTPPVRLLYAFCFLIFLEWSMIVPSILPYFALLGDTEEEARMQYALAQAGCALMQLVSSLLSRPLLRWSGDFLPLFAASSLLIIAGSLLYAVADPSLLNSSAALLAGRLLCGLGGGGSTVGMTYIAHMCRDDPRRGQKLSLYRSAGVIAVPVGGVLAGIFANVEFHIGKYSAHGPTLPGLFTAVCFAFWLLLALWKIRGSSVGRRTEKAYRCDSQIAALMCIVFSAALTGASLLYVMPIIMTQLLQWGMAAASAAYTVATFAGLLGACVGYSRRAIRFNAEQEGFDAFPLLLAAAALTLLGVALVWLATWLPRGLGAEAAFVLGVALAMFAQSLMSTAGGVVVSLALTGPEGAGMGPLLRVLIAVSKLVSPLFLVVEIMLAGWPLAMGIWSCGVFCLLLAVALVRKVALFKGSSDPG